MDVFLLCKSGSNGMEDDEVHDADQNIFFNFRASKLPSPRIRSVQNSTVIASLTLELGLDCHLVAACETFFSC
jgi:hypothetical protein